MVDPTSDIGADVTAENAPRCVTCDDPIVNEPTHRVRTWVENGAVETRHFCSEVCREAWNDDR